MFNRINLIQSLININERIVFYPRLKSFYRSAVTLKKPVIVDVGANKGQTVDFFLKLYPNATIYSFEPNKKLYNKLADKYSKHNNVTVFNLGISDTKGSLTFHENILDETSSFEQVDLDSKYLRKKARVLGVKPEDIIAGSYEVEVTTLSDFIKAHGIDHVNILKIDTEGHEYKCLHGLFSETNAASMIDYIQLEQHYDDMYGKERAAENIIDHLLAANGYKHFKRIRHGFGDFDEIIYKAVI